MKKDNKELELLLNEIFKERNIDFFHYREKFLERRMAARIRATRCSSYEEYIQFLRDNKKEMDALLSALTINVTHFFRDFKVFETIKNKVIPLMFEEKKKKCKEMEKLVFKVWSCGCSGGEEPTTILILFLEYLKKHPQKTQICIYGTDIDKLSIEKAKKGIYEEYEFKETPQELREKYFLNLKNGYFMRNKELNKFLFFKEHDIVKEEPLLNMDLILCRNVFIYFKRELQELCIEKFYRALNKGGFLILGLTEFLWEPFSKKFSSFDRSSKIYRKKEE
jgi:chemotaxis protein methyltransferase CheR